MPTSTLPAYLIALLREAQGGAARCSASGVKRVRLHRLLREHGVSAADFVRAPMKAARYEKSSSADMV